MIFDETYYRRGDRIEPDVNRYRLALQDQLARCASDEQRKQLLHGEAIEITRHILEGVRYVANHDRGVKRAVFDQGVIPLGLWVESLKQIAAASAVELQDRLRSMKREYEEGRFGGFAGTMIIHGQPTFESLKDFYNVVFTEMNR